MAYIKYKIWKVNRIIERERIDNRTFDDIVIFIKCSAVSALLGTAFGLLVI